MVLIASILSCYLIEKNSRYIFDSKMDPKTPVKKNDKQRYIAILRVEEIKKALESIPRHLQQLNLRETFINQTGLN
jgi:hypothetical protein